MIICSYEDRPAASIGIKLLLLSLARTAPGVPIDVTSPALADGLTAWSKRAGLTSVSFRAEKGWSGSSWNVKPGKLLELLDEGHDEVIWIDSDIVAYGDFRPMIKDLPGETIVVGQEFRSEHPVGGRLRAEGWGLDYGRYLPYTTNSGFLRVTPAHRPLLHRWRELLGRPDYLHVQSLPIPERPMAMISDQDVLWALLSSSEFSSVPVLYLKCGDQIIQNSGANGYHVVERLRNVWRGLPPLVHALGKEKPWSYPIVPSPSRNRRDYLELAVLELSPYVWVGSHYAEGLGESAPWLRPRTALARTFRLLALGHPSLQGLPLALLAAILERMGRRAKV